MDPLQIDDTFNDNDTLHDTFNGGSHNTTPDWLDDDNDDDPYDSDGSNNNDEDTEDDTHDTNEDLIDNETGGDDTEDDLHELEDDDDTPFLGHDDKNNDKNNEKHHGSNDSPTTDRLVVPDFTLTPPSPQAEAKLSPLTSGPKGGLRDNERQRPFPLVPKAPRARAPKVSPPFFRLASAHYRSGKSGRQFANRMFTNWSSLKARSRAVQRGPKGAGVDQAEGCIRPTKMRRIVGDQ